MLFNSGIFLQFFAAFLLLYWSVREKITWRNWLIVAASYLFYGWWDVRFLGLLVIASVMDYAVALWLGKTEDAQKRKWLITVSMVGNLGILGLFKYYGFFVTSFAAMAERIGWSVHLPTLEIVLPVGISFYTFQTMSYTLDVYRREIPATRSLVNFLAFVSFFPQLVAGPIERAKHLLPQFERTLVITRNDVADGIWLCLWGLFKKVVIADNLAPLVEMAYAAPGNSGPLVMAGTAAFAIQIYCDFSGYSDVARGLAKLLGFDLMLNFNLPYLATSIREFWRRWHISLSTWLRDYLYVSLGGNRKGSTRTAVNLFLTMLLGGLWHGAAWNFILWGAWHGVGLLVHRRWAEARKDVTPSLGYKVFSWMLTLAFVGYGWMLFRATSWDQIVTFTTALAQWQTPVWFGNYLLVLGVFILPLALMQIWQARSGNLMVAMTLRPWAQYALQGFLLWAIWLYWEREATPFIYFQF